MENGCDMVKCPRCNRSFVTKNGMLTHMRLYCGVEPQFHCSLSAVNLLDISSSVPLYQPDAMDDSGGLESHSNTDGEIGALTQWSDTSLGVSMEEALDITSQVELEIAPEIHLDIKTETILDITPDVSQESVTTSLVSPILDCLQVENYPDSSFGRNMVLTPVVYLNSWDNLTTSPSEIPVSIPGAYHVPSSRENSTVTTSLKNTVFTSRKNPVTSKKNSKIGAEKKTYKCPQCGRTYTYANSLFRHQKYECGTEPKFPCPHCNHKSRHKNHLRSHIFALHPDLAEPSL
ncbi:hypothetical protein LSTR_LSTR000998 [Laodelphax striatellus]|uniref:C2H2-type domain-containing protein n=1 Tax=Laodelphax striatellus TaxID=195883 RepID=A0A482X0T8_LAOST|nr:hypothetical protein LSTR_LSTR000998 [Laodelphax striatellus]